MNGMGMIASRMQALQERAEKAEGALARVEEWGRDQAKPFVDGVRDREGEAVWEGLQAAITGEQS